MVFIPLVQLITRRYFRKLKTACKILDTTQTKFNLILAGDYGRLEVDEMIRYTAKIISYYFQKSRVNERKRKETGK